MGFYRLPSGLKTIKRRAFPNPKQRTFFGNRHQTNHAHIFFSASCFPTQDGLFRNRGGFVHQRAGQRDFLAIKVRESGRSLSCLLLFLMRCMVRFGGHFVVILCFSQTGADCYHSVGFFSFAKGLVPDMQDIGGHITLFL